MRAFRAAGVRVVLWRCKDCWQQEWLSNGKPTVFGRGLLEVSDEN